MPSAMQGSREIRAGWPHAVLAPVVAVAAIAYIFRFPGVLGAGVSIFRVVTIFFVIYVWWIVCSRGGVLLRSPFVLRMIFGAFLAFSPTLLDLAFHIDAPDLAAPIYAFWGNLLFLVVFSIAVGREDVDVYLRWYCYVSVFESVVALYAYFTLSFPLEFIIREFGTDYVRGLALLNVDGEYVRLTGTFFDPNFYGIYLVSVIVIGQWIFFHRGRNWIYLAISLLSFGQLVLTASRTAMLGLCGVLFAILILRRVRVRIWMPLVLFAMVFGGLVVAFDNQLADRLLSGESVVERLEFFRRGLEAFELAPIFGSGSPALVDPSTGLSSAHSVYISLLGRSGLLGLAAYALSFLVLAYPLLAQRGIGTSQREFLLQFIMMIGVVFLSYDILYFFEPLFVWLALMLVFTKGSDGESASAVSGTLKEAH